MKTIKVLLLTLVLFTMTGLNSLFACEIEFAVQGKKKDKYKAGDVIVVKVKVTFTHKVCQIAIKDTKFDTKGLKVAGATEWEETSPNVWERKLKLKVLSNKAGKLTLTATRTCNREGGFGSISFAAVPLKE